MWSSVQFYVTKDLSILKVFFSFQVFIFCHRSCVLTLIRPTKDFLCENDFSWWVFLEKLSFCFDHRCSALPLIRSPENNCVKKRSFINLFNLKFESSSFIMIVVCPQWYSVQKILKCNWYFNLQFVYRVYVFIFQHCCCVHSMKRPSQYF